MTVVVSALAWTAGTAGADDLCATAAGWAVEAVVAGAAAAGWTDAGGAAPGDAAPGDAEDGAGSGFIFE